MTSHIAEYQTILTYWFADALTGLPALQARMGFWFANDAKIDDEIRQRFGHLPERLREQPDYWLSQDQAEQDQIILAKVIVWDQFTRNIYRGTAQAFAYDDLALATAVQAIEQGIFARIHPVSSHFLMLPFEHSEDLAIQEQGVAISTSLLQQAPAELTPMFEHFLKWARIHRDLIARFGRFPHRNQALGRLSTAEELEYLRDGERFGQ